MSLTYDLHGKSVTYESFWHKPGYELFLTMRAFANDLPELGPRPLTEPNDNACRDAVSGRNLLTS